MNTPQHFTGHCIAIVLLAICNYTFLPFTDDWIYFLALIPSFVINCDLDFIFKKWGIHRNFFFHSAILPLTIYGSLRKYLILLPNQYWGEITLWFFFPVIVHLILDFKIGDVIDALIGDGIEYTKKAIELKKKVKKAESQGRKVKPQKIKINEGDQQVGGSYQVNFRPFTKKNTQILWYNLVVCW